MACRTRMVDRFEWFMALWSHMRQSRRDITKCFDCRYKERTQEDNEDECRRERAFIFQKKGGKNGKSENIISGNVI